MNYEVKYAMKHGDQCPYCEQVLHGPNGVFECGGEGEGICSVWSAIYAFGRAAKQLLSRSAIIDVELWIDALSSSIPRPSASVQTATTPPRLSSIF